MKGKVMGMVLLVGCLWFVIECEKRQDAYDDIVQCARFLKPYVDLVNALGNGNALGGYARLHICTLEH